MFLAIASSILSASTFGVPFLTYLRNCISCFKSPKEPSACMLRLILNAILHQKGFVPDFVVGTRFFSLWGFGIAFEVHCMPAVVHVLQNTDNGTISPIVGIFGKWIFFFLYKVHIDDDTQDRLMAKLVEVILKFHFDRQDIAKTGKSVKAKLCALDRFSRLC